MIVADASVLIGWLDDHDVHHGAAIDVLASVDRFVVHPLTLAEVLVHPGRGGREDDVVARLEAIGMMVSRVGNPCWKRVISRLEARTMALAKDDWRCSRA